MIELGPVAMPAYEAMTTDSGLCNRLPPQLKPNVRTVGLLTEWMEQY